MTARAFVALMGFFTAAYTALFLATCHVDLDPVDEIPPVDQRQAPGEPVPETHTEVLAYE